MHIKIYGGLGNQIFQLGAGLVIADDLNLSKIRLDDQGVKNYAVKRESMLNDFFNFSDLPFDISFSSSFVLKHRLAKLLPFSSSVVTFCSDKNFNKPKNEFCRNFYLDGYFQNQLNQSDFDRQISFLKPALKNNSTASFDGAVIHIRGGDFIALGWNLVTPLNYYNKAIDYLIKTYNVSKFNIVTDDAEYASKITTLFSNVDFNFIGGGVLDDFHLIGAHRFRILSSSTFALWSSALANNDDSVVIAPSFWKPNSNRAIFLPNEVRLEGF